MIKRVHTHICSTHQEILQPQLSEQQQYELHLVQRIKDRDKAAFAELYDKYSAALYGVVLRVVNKDAELAQDVMQDACVKIWKNIEGYDKSKGTLFTWMLNIARNTAIDKTRALQRHPIQNLDSFVSISRTSDKEVSTSDHIGLNEVIEKLKPEQKTVIDLAYFGGFTQEEIAEKLSLPLGTVKTRVRSALMDLRKLLK